MYSHTPIQSSFRDFLRIVFKRKYQIILFFIITVSVIVGITVSIEPTYQATAQILVKIGSRDLYTLPSSTGERIVDSSRTRTNQQNTEKEFLRSRFLAEKVLNQLGPEYIYPEEKSIDEDSMRIKLSIFLKSAIESTKEMLFQKSGSDSIKSNPPQPSNFELQVLKLQKNLSIRGIVNTNIIQISFKHSNPETAATVVNTYMEIYFDERLQFHRKAQSPTFFRDQILKLKNTLEEAENELEQFKNENNITDLDQQQRILLQEISSLRVDLNSVLSEEIETESRITLLKKQLNQTPNTIPQREVTDYNQILLSRLEAQLVGLQIEEKELLSKYTPQNRMVKNVRERILIVESKIKEQENKLVQRSSFVVNPTYQRLEEELYRNQSELGALSVKKEVLAKQLADFESEKEGLNRMETRLNNLQQSIDLYRNNYKLYLAKLEAARIEDAMDNEKINEVITMDRALPPLKPISPNYKLNIILAILIGGMGGLLLAIIGDLVSDSIETPEDVEKTLHLPVLTSIPDNTNKKRLDYKKEVTQQSNLKIQFP